MYHRKIKHLYRLANYESYKFANFNLHIDLHLVSYIGSSDHIHGYFQKWIELLLYLNTILPRKDID